METKIMKLTDIQPADYNPRVKLTETDFEYKALKTSIDTFGLVVPLIVNKKTGTLISGHQRLNVMLKNGIEETEVVVVDMEPEKEKALCIAMNKVCGQWDYGMLADIMEELRNSEIDTVATGFSDNEIAELLGELQEVDADIPEIDSVDKKEDTGDGVPCIVGEYKFRIPDASYKDMMADIREKVGFSKEMVESELQRRLFKCLSKQ
ncbi:ParB N-terminal domain-containing protein [Anthropogastromicrobium aceti]|uniref:ParB N-terminal domain-containing protein n=1 Tax=Anthropogastromicrobium aceti TaxID=2981768 RepID=UPI000822CD04|nr:ParB N-terminal domain-containing protein [Anthropogastromicrobium aceti]MCU6783919.1 ParB N-terminal domain-containing protein [Anthropogastromicrobium aceti]SCJ50289.1 ParB-like nuclease domain [uncultured Lachnospira sp.]